MKSAHCQMQCPCHMQRFSCLFAHTPGACGGTPAPGRAVPGTLQGTARKVARRTAPEAAQKVLRGPSRMPRGSMGCSRAQLSGAAVRHSSGAGPGAHGNVSCPWHPGPGAGFPVRLNLCHVQRQHVSSASLLAGQSPPQDVQPTRTHRDRQGQGAHLFARQRCLALGTGRHWVASEPSRTL